MGRRNRGRVFRLDCEQERGGPRKSFKAEAWRDEWNNAFYAHLAYVLMDEPDERFAQELTRVMVLPDDAFAPAVSVIAIVADVIYFADPTCPARRAVVLRRRLVERAVTMRSWQFDHEPGALSIDHDTRDLFGTLLFNQANALCGTSSYLVPSGRPDQSASRRCIGASERWTDDRNRALYNECAARSPALPPSKFRSRCARGVACPPSGTRWTMERNGCRAEGRRMAGGRNRGGRRVGRPRSFCTTQGRSSS